MNKSISEKICELRKARKLTQEQLGISGQAVSKWETGTSMPDILLLPSLCAVLGISVEALLEMPLSQRHETIVSDFCKYARRVGRAHAVCDVSARLFNDVGANHGGTNVFLSSSEVRVSDERGMSFVLDAEPFKKSCIEMKNEEIISFLKIFTDETALSVLKMIKMDDAVTKAELEEALGIDSEEVMRVLLELMERNLVCVGIDERGKRGYLQSENMAGAYMVLGGCRIAGSGGSLWMSRM